jgi:uncharacterized protein (DUF924 family)
VTDSFPAPAGDVTPADILSFWRAAGPGKWFVRDEVFDAEVRLRFLATYEAAAAGHLVAWEKTAEGALALVIVLDQFPRNMFRGSARTYAADSLALVTAERAIAYGHDQLFPPVERRFFYLPYMHSEELADQWRCIALCRAAEDEIGIKSAEEHAEIIRRFGRFPHRNALVGRKTTAEEQAFLDAGGFAG